MQREIASRYHTSQIDVNGKLLELWWRIYAFWLFRVEILSLNNACIGKDEIQSSTTGDKNGFKCGGQLSIIGDIGFMEGRLS